MMMMGASLPQHDKTLRLKNNRKSSEKRRRRRSGARGFHFGRRRSLKKIIIIFVRERRGGGIYIYIWGELHTIFQLIKLCVVCCCCVYFTLFSCRPRQRSSRKRKKDGCRVWIIVMGSFVNMLTIRCCCCGGGDSVGFRQP